VWDVLWKFRIFCARITVKIKILVHSKDYPLRRGRVVHVNIASESAHSSLAQGIAEIRNCRFGEVATGVSIAK